MGYPARDCEEVERRGGAEFRVSAAKSFRGRRDAEWFLPQKTDDKRIKTP